MKKVILGLMVVVTASFVGCKEEEHGHNHVTITFEEPVNDAVIPLADAASVHIHIEFVYEEEGEEIEVKLHPEGDENDLIIDYDLHTHDNPISFEQDVNLSSYAAGTEFHLTAKACEDHSCDEFVTSDIHFSLGQ